MPLSNRPQDDPMLNSKLTNRVNKNSKALISIRYGYAQSFGKTQMCPRRASFRGLAADCPPSYPQHRGITNLLPGSHSVYEILRPALTKSPHDFQLSQSTVEPNPCVPMRPRLYVKLQRDSLRPKVGRRNDALKRRVADHDGVNLTLSWCSVLPPKFVALSNTA